MTWVPLNLNVRVRFKPTAEHHLLHEQSQRRDLGAMYHRVGYPLRPDAEGYVTMSLWNYAHEFGPGLYMGTTMSAELEMETAG